MSRPDATPVNSGNENLQGKLDGSIPAPAAAPAAPVVPAVAPDAAPVPAAPPAGVPAVEPAAAAPVIEAPVLPDADPVPAAPAWEPTGNATLDAIGTLFDEKGVDGRDAMKEFTEHGEISQETYDGLVASLGKSTADIVHGQFGVAVGALKQDAQQAADSIYESVGGKESWDQVAAWSKRLPEAERTEYNKLLKSGGVAATLAAKSLQEKMMADPQFKSRAALVGGGAAPVAGGQAAPSLLLDRATYGTAIREAEQRGDQQQIASLRESAKHAMKNNPNWKLGNPK